MKWCQAGRKQRLLKEGVDPNAEKTRIGHEILQLIDASLDCGPNEAERKSEGEHNRETNGSHQCGALEDAKPLGKALVEKAVVESNDYAGNQDRAQEACVEGGHATNRLDAGLRSRKIHVEHGAEESQKVVDENVEGHVQHEGFKRRPSLCLIGQAVCEADGE